MGEWGRSRDAGEIVEQSLGAASKGNIMIATTPGNLRAEVERRWSTGSSTSPFHGDLRIKSSSSRTTGATSRMSAVVLLAAHLVMLSAKVEVGSAPSPSSGMAVHLTNNASQAVNAYVTAGGSDVFIGQVGANSVKTLSVSGVSSGSSVTLKAKTADGARTYTKDNVSLTSSTDWTVPLRHT